ncbi:MAG: CBS domain-containing protein [Candidatus Altiarchaeota archaeon]|nr:CBS domain-containing protein [Candidatus Altiarchaeota archaeon]
MKGYEILLNELRKIKKGWQVRDLMTTNVKTIKPDATVSKAVRDMKRYGIHGLVVTDGGKPKGIITTYDALFVIARGESGDKVLVKDVMSTGPISTHPEDDILNALERMLDNQLTKLPVVSDDGLVGILSATDLVDALDKGILERKPTKLGKLEGYRKVKLTIRDVMREPTILEPEITVYEAAKKMTEKGIESVLVRKKDLLGIVTQMDIFKKVIAEGHDTKTVKVSDVMSSPCHMIGPDEGIGDASKLFNEHNIGRLPVVEDNRVIGIVSIRDISKTIAMRYRL